MALAPPAPPRTQPRTLHREPNPDAKRTSWQKVNTRIDPRRHRLLRIYLAIHETSMQSVFEQFVDHLLERNRDDIERAIREGAD